MLASLAGAQEPSPGIARDLARSRAANVSEVRYELKLDLRENASEVAGHVVIFFRLTDAATTAPLVLDFAGEKVTDLRVNEVPQDPAVARSNNHLMLGVEDLQPGRNQVRVAFTSRVAPTGTPLTVFRDPARGEEFLYTLVVPADAHALFPCFDQPDLKAVFNLRLTVPKRWSVVSNAPEQPPSEDAEDDALRVVEFADTKPLSTYLMAFAAGPFEVIEAPGRPGTPMNLYVRRGRLGEVDPKAMFGMHERSLRWLEDYFGTDYPFGKLDIVLLPGFPYGGMEHAGAIFYRESSLVFDHEPTESELVRRSALIYHEVSHQWFGNLVTMEWFDDLWLKEGFATFIGYHVLAALEPARNAWLRFHQRVKPRAYRIDATPGTTPVYQQLGNLADAKSAYGAIVYNKAPAVLRELHERLGAKKFSKGVQLFLERHAFGNARWDHLVKALEEAAGTDLTAWSKRWILAPGMPRVRARWSAEDGVITKFEIVQESVQGQEGTWPLRLQVQLGAGEKGTRDIWVETSDAVTPVHDLVGTPAPSCVLLNPQDVAYGQFLLDEQSLDHLLDALPKVRDPLVRAVALSALVDTMREGELDPRRYADLALRMLAKAQDPLDHAWLLGSLGTVVGRYLHDADREKAVGRVTEVLFGQLMRGMPDRALQTFRFLARVSDADEVLGLCEGLLTGRTKVDGLELGTQDRYLALAALLAAGRGEDLAGQMTGGATPGGAEKYAYLALAAAPDAATKKRYFESYLNPDEPPEQWMQGSLGYFHWAGQGDVTLPWLAPALDRLEWVKEHRKIFFMPAWIDGFVGAHASRKALEIAESYLAPAKKLPKDIRLKLLQSIDGLRKAVAIRERWK